MDNNNKTASISAKLVEAKLLHFRKTPLTDSLTDAPDNYEFSTNIEFTVSREEKTISTKLKVLILDNGSKELYAEIESQFSLVIENFEEVVVKETNGQIQFTPFAFILCASTAISTTRGMMILASAGTILSNALLPLIDASKLVPTDGEISLGN